MLSAHAPCRWGLLRPIIHAAQDVGVYAVVTNFPKMVMEAIENRLFQCGSRMAAYFFLFF